jgi:tRNA pseudouridine13 synthase
MAGMGLGYLSRSSGIGGTIKSAPEDFLVEEIGLDGTLFAIGQQATRPDASGPGLDAASVATGAYTHFILQKTDWSTSSAISEIAKRLHASERNFNIAGSKDKVATTTQIASVRGDWRDSLAALRVKDISIRGAWLAPDRVRLGDLLGNRFSIRVQGASDDAAKRVQAITEELGGRFPNYFGEQRFGSSRRNTHLVGGKLLGGDLEGALMEFLCATEGEAHAEAVLARKELKDTRDYGRALAAFPRHLRLERSMLAHLARKPDDISGAFRALPRNMLLMFIHAFQSDLFNRMLSERLASGPLELEEGEYFCGEAHGFPDISKTEGEGWIAGRLIGFNTMLNPREKELLGALGMGKDAFRMKAMPELASKGAYRTLLAPLKDFKFDSESVTFGFALPSGSYATVAMREFMDSKHGG